MSGGVFTMGGVITGQFNATSLDLALNGGLFRG